MSDIPGIPIENEVETLALIRRELIQQYNDNSAWNLALEDGDIRVLTRDLGRVTVRTEAILPGSLAKVLEFFNDLRNREKWDTLCKERKALCQKGDGIVYYYYCTNPRFPASSRDTYLLENRFQDETCHTTYYPVVEIPNMPETSGIVRMKVFPGGVIISAIVDSEGKVVDEKCRIVEILDSDLCGYIPSFVVTKVITKDKPESMKKLIAAIKKFKN